MIASFLKTYTCEFKNAKMEYFKMQLDHFSGSVILMLTFLIGISLGWIFRGSKSQKNAINISTDNKVRSVNYKQFTVVLSGVLHL